MTDQKPLAVASYLPTLEDYQAFSLAAGRLKTPAGTKCAARILGGVAAGLGAALFLFTNPGVTEGVCWAALFFFGLFLMSYFDVVQPYSIKKRALVKFEASRRMLVSQTVELFDREFTVRTDRYEARLPYELLHRVVEDGRMYLLYTGEDEVRFIPKRVMTEEQCGAFTQALRERMGERYSG
ncbi:MAG: YcxB family protein [Clostridiales bacterium]|jgi:hypothetical protein|nr:YcxB family protein [Clostridiales bacterium]